ncbi:tail fiber domain-containing protein [Erythrobacter insulae]|uniref:Tail fiber domain-containing protein n=1 Tax=Erythrobacter insulae TaxID=2584124 RepID=A0A547PCF1_9SPHN|nr:tail fiber domain-containing protein [Erythrobacter insulae]TRD11811.1 tail fiber domain-containing protein [Erythrobacter insulae]
MKTSRERQTYVRPVLLYYGSVRNLTGGSSGPGNDGFGGFSGLTGGGMDMGMSDRRLKQNVRKIGDHPAGFGLYLFDYRPEFSEICSGQNVFGVMADEVRKVCPDAVSLHRSGYWMVDYARLDITQQAAFA